MRNNRALGALLVFQLTVMPAGANGGDREVSVMREAYKRTWSDVREVRYAEPSDDPEWRTTQSLMEALLRGERSPALQEQAKALGWRLRRGVDGGRAWSVLEELPERRSGRGLYAFSDDGGRHAIEAPHVPSDLHTGEIAVSIGQESKPRAIAWNSVHRREADLPQLRNSAMHAFSRAFAAHFAQERIVQLHGFDAKRSDRAGDSERGAILSSTQRTPSAEFRALADCMRRNVEPGTRLFGDDADELGGTRNQIARELIASGFRGFVHLEMGLALRESLRNDADRRRALLDCIGVPG